MLVTKSSQLPQVSLAKVWNFTSSAPGTSNILVWLHPECLFPWGCSLEVKGLVKIILALRQCPEGRGHSSTNHPVFQVLRHGTSAPARLHRASLHGPGQPRPLRTSHRQDLAGLTGDLDLDLQGWGILSQCRLPKLVAHLLTHSGLVFAFPLPLFTHCWSGLRLST